MGGADAAGQTKQSWTDCSAREIAAVIRGCTAMIESGARGKSRLAQARLNRGKAFVKRGDFAEAIADFGEAIRLAPTNVEAYRERGDAYWSKKKMRLPRRISRRRSA